ncbi:1-aminocyclopropane-1-carboxylate deaminase/D-cysteine desulfhydrase [Motilimonas pumila]|uniref:1-aminocyclopropane-1-carboxylate deaminase/D-cysteine desulfhydrase n=1 Tax=Motilimonas pumila TaxID=2303987 RepID=A0A418YCH6_9GAMM|nr:1-aminocyclopropane-1-carboxylate deaminase/D-cysteine desulfhydrase [Motilimonas pumila]RJG42220.1 1-aminocyclopropane-1-carboxylate deaminase/D-cysteine desulfhydrase [Motilimonas pumila]
MSDLLLSGSPVELSHFQGQDFYIKRDDLLSADFSGNKARKFHFLLQQKPHQLQRLIAYGSAQANSLLSLAALCKHQGWQLEYYVNRVPPMVQQSGAASNYQRAIALGASVITWPVELSSSQVEGYLQAKAAKDNTSLFVSEGGRIPEAEIGIAELANELQAWADKNSIADWVVVLPSGTGTTALFLQQHLLVPVYTCACVGGESYLKHQFSSLIKDTSRHPKVINAKQKYHFGKLKLSSYQIWLKLLAETRIEFELLYDPMAWQVIMPWLQRHRPNTTVVYIHQGGVRGNVTMLPRYQRKYPLEGE